MVITGLTRNQFGSNPTRVRIPPSPPYNNVPFDAVGKNNKSNLEEFSNEIKKIICTISYTSYAIVPC